MGSSAQDKGTQSASSAAAQNVSAQQVANATEQQANSNAAYKTLFGSAGADGKLAGGTVSGYLSAPSNTAGLTGSYNTAYTTAANTNAATAQNAVATTQQNLASRGVGATPAGFEADQQRKAYADQAASNADQYTAQSQKQLSDALSNYWQANTLLGNYGSAQTAAATANNSGAAGTNTSLYGTASQQKQTAAGALLGAAAGAGAAYLGGR